MSLALQIYEKAMRRTLRLWRLVRSRDAIYDAVAEAFTRHLASARANGTLRKELGTWVSRTAGEILLGRKARGARAIAGSSDWIETIGVGNEDGYVALLDADEPPPERDQAVIDAAYEAVRRLVERGWLQKELAEEFGVSPATVCRWCKGARMTPAAAEQLLALAAEGRPPPRQRSKLSEAA